MEIVLVSPYQGHRKCSGVGFVFRPPPPGGEWSGVSLHRGCGGCVLYFRDRFLGVASHEW